MFTRLFSYGICLAFGFFLSDHQAWANWQPKHPVEFIVPAGVGGGADQMARMIQSIIVKHKLLPTSMVVVNESGESGAEALLHLQRSSGDPYKLIITLSNLFTTPYSTGIPFNWSEMTPVSMMALDEFVLWVNAADPIRNVADYVAAVRAAKPGEFTMGGTGKKQEDQIITVALAKIIGAPITYVPLGGGGDVAQNLTDGHVRSTVNNPIEAVAQWRAGKLRPLCVFDASGIPHVQNIVGKKAWVDIPTCGSQGLPLNYKMLRAVFLPGDVSADQLQYYTTLLQTVRATPEWKAMIAEAAYDTELLTGNILIQWLKSEDRRHYRLMREAGFLAR